MKFAKVALVSLVLTIGCIAPLKMAEPAQSSEVAQLGSSSLASWQSYHSPSGQFAVQFPGQPETHMRTLPIAVQSYDWTVLRLKNEAGFYGVAFTDLMPTTIELGASAIVESIENTLTDEFNWSALNGNGKSMAIDGYPARELIGTRNNQLSVLRLILADQRLYVVMGSSQDLTELGQFVNSFEVEPWQPYVSREGRFSVNLPLSPTGETESIELGGTELHWNVIESRNFTAPGDSYSVGYTDVSPTDLQAGAEALLNRIGSNLLMQWNARNVIESGRAISLDGNPGRSFVGMTDGGQIIVVQLYLVGSRMYGVGVLSDDITHISRFLNSFSIQ